MDARPPTPPWSALNPVFSAGGYLSFYYCDDLSPLPVRWVTKPSDNKSDPNLETGTYGLFSTCSPGMRSGVVRKHSGSIFFCTRKNGRRELTGLYRLAYFTKGPLGNRDYCLAAESLHFVSSGIPLHELDAKFGTRFARRFRGALILSEQECRYLEEVLLQYQNASADYLAEIDRLERFNLKHGGFRYLGWQQSHKFDWAYAREYLRATVTTSQSQPNTSATNTWRCNSCGNSVKNKALLKRCPKCGNLGSLIPSI